MVAGTWLHEVRVHSCIKQALSACRSCVIYAASSKGELNVRQWPIRNRSLSVNGVIFLLRATFLGTLSTRIFFLIARDVSREKFPFRRWNEHRAEQLEVNKPTRSLKAIVRSAQLQSRFVQRKCLAISPRSSTNPKNIFGIIGTGNIYCDRD